MLVTSPDATFQASTPTRLRRSNAAGENAELTKPIPPACARCLSRYENLAAERPVLAAISGGVDSTLLLHALHRLGSDGRLPGPLHVAHVDHGVRPDSRFLKRLV